MNKKRGNGEGTIRRNGNRWIARVMVHGSRITVSGKTRGEAAEKLTEAKKTAAVVSEKLITVEEWLAKWQETYLVKMRTSTRGTYQAVIRNQIIPELGSIKIADLTPGHIAEMFARLAKTLASKTIELVYGVLTKALRQAVVSEVAYRNVMQSVKKPRAETKEHSIFSQEDFRKFLDAASGHPFGLGYLIIAYCGLRRGEALGLRWSDVSLERKEISINETYVMTFKGPEKSAPKTKLSRRTIGIPNELLADLQAVPKRLRIGLVTKGKDGRPVHPDVFFKCFQDLLSNAGLPRITIHELRHTHASLLIHAGVDLSTVSRRLGHSSTKTTGDIYAHMVPGEQDKCVKTISEISRGGEKQM